MNNKTAQFTCKTCNTLVYRLGSRVNAKDQLCGKCNQGDPLRFQKQFLKTAQSETLLVKEESPNASLDQVKVETPLDKAVKDYNKQWKEDKLETQSLERFLDGNKAA